MKHSLFCSDPVFVKYSTKPIWWLIISESIILFQRFIPADWKRRCLLTAANCSAQLSSARILITVSDQLLTALLKTRQSAIFPTVMPFWWNCKKLPSKQQHHLWTSLVFSLQDSVCLCALVWPDVVSYSRALVWRAPLICTLTDRPIDCCKALWVIKTKKVAAVYLLATYSNIILRSFFPPFSVFFPFSPSSIFCPASSDPTNTWVDSF